MGVYLTFSGVYPLYHIYWGLSMGKEKAPPRGAGLGKGDGVEEFSKE
jgi:hypothetical protein